MVIRMESALASGVCTHSSAEAFNAYVIFCVGNDIAREAAFKAWAADNGIHVKSLIGSYNGVSERSFMVNYQDAVRCWDWYSNEETVLGLAPLWDPVHNRMLGSRPASLIYISDYSVANKKIGFFTEQSKEYALAQPSYTFDPSTGKYWVAE